MCKIVNNKLQIDDQIYESVLHSYESSSPKVGSICIGSIVKRVQRFPMFNLYLKVCKIECSDPLFVVTAISGDMITLGELGKQFNKDNFKLIGSVPYQ